MNHSGKTRNSPDCAIEIWEHIKQLYFQFYGIFASKPNQYMKSSRTFQLARSRALILAGALVLSCGRSQEKKHIAESDVSDLIRINQVGYYPFLGKRFTLADTQAESFMLIDDKGKIVFRGELSDEGFWEPSGETLKSGNFSAFNKEGTYFIHVPGYVAGGPNGHMQDRGDVEKAGVAYPDTHPARSYIDHTSSYASNEIAINWNAPLVLVLAYLNQQ